MTRSARELLSLLSGALALLVSGCFTVAGIAYAARDPVSPTLEIAVQTESSPGKHVIEAESYAEAENAMVTRLISAIEKHGVRLRSATFAAASRPSVVQATFEVEGAPSSVWRTVHELEAGNPTMVFERVRVRSTGKGETDVTLSATLRAAWLSQRGIGRIIDTNKTPRQ